MGSAARQKATIRALGLRRLHQSVEHDDTPTIRGMIDAVPFAVKVAGRGAAEGETSASGKTQ